LQLLAKLLIGQWTAGSQFPIQQINLALLLAQFCVFGGYCLLQFIKAPA